MIAPRPPARLECFGCHAATVVQERPFSNPICRRRPRTSRMRPSQLCFILPLDRQNICADVARDAAAGACIGTFRVTASFRKNKQQTESMKKKLAITISGAVSLGSYEAGVLYEVIRAIGLHNQNSNTAADDKIYIDEIGRASAGGMTATIAAQKLLYEAQSLSGAYTNAFYSPWVAEISIQRRVKGVG